MLYSKIDGRIYCNMLKHASNKLEEQRDLINSLNVFPIPDGDTGTNMSMTLKSAIAEIQNYKGNSIGEVSKLVSRGALMGARGNSGVILSQILRGMAKGLENKNEADTKDFAEALAEGAHFAYKAVMRPTEGTILTVIKAAAECALESVSENFIEFFDEITTHSLIILNKTPEMLPVLKKANVVDAGGKGLLVLLQGMRDVLAENIESVEILDSSQVSVSTAEIEDEVYDEFANQSEIRFKYCTEFIIKSSKGDTNAFKEKLEQIGDSLVIVNDGSIIKVHMHTNEPGVVLTEALKLGELSGIKIDNMDEQHTSMMEGQSNKIYENQKKYAIISVAAGKGLKKIFEDLGADYVIEGGQTMNPSTQDILNAISKLRAEHIFILPNNKNIIMAATQAAELSDKNVHVVQTKTIPQGIAALTAFNNMYSTEENLKLMNKSAETVSTGSVTYAIRDTEIDGFNIKQGDIIGLVDGKMKKVGNDPYSVAEQLLDMMVDNTSELITVFYGNDCTINKVEELMDRAEKKYPDLDVQYYDGGQPLYYFLISVE